MTSLACTSNASMRLPSSSNADRSAFSATVA